MAVRNFAKEDIERREKLEADSPLPAPELVKKELDLGPVVPPPEPAVPAAPPGPDPKTLEELDRFRTDAERARQEAAELRKVLEEERLSRDVALFNSKRQEEELAELRKSAEELERQKAMSALADFRDEDFATLGAEDAKKLVKAAAELAKRDNGGRLDAIEKRFAEQDTQWRAFMQSSHQTYAATERERLNREILTAHPDFDRLMNDREFRAVLDSPASYGSRTTVQQVMAKELQEGSADYAIEVIRKFKSGRPSLEDIAQVDSASAGKISGPVPAAPFTGDRPSELLDQVRLGRMSREEFRARRKARP
ncbi:MAG: hypothetical protein LBQ79_00480, partial [Deltaproteobacteria bacterium]|nr:hypothetical protein [Deltaproteobacteria bacterium]